MHAGLHPPCAKPGAGRSSPWAARSASSWLRSTPRSASKFALTNLCKQAAIEHAPDGIRVNVVAPTATDTGLFMRVSEEAPDPEALRRQVAANLPAGRLGTAEDVCQAVLYLASDHSSYVSGAVLPLDGGLAARRM